MDEVKRKHVLVCTYPALLLSSSQPLDWPGLGWALRSHWDRVTQNHKPTEGERRKETRKEKKEDGGV